MLVHVLLGEAGDGLGQARHLSEGVEEGDLVARRVGLVAESRAGVGEDDVMEHHAGERHGAPLRIDEACGATREIAVDLRARDAADVVPFVEP